MEKTKHEEVCEAFKISRDKFFKFREDCFRFTKTFFDAFCKYFEYPDDNYTFLPPDVNIYSDDVKPVSLFAAMKLEEDGFWYFRIRFKVYSAPNEFPQENLNVPFGITQNIEDGSFKIKFNRDGKTWDYREENVDFQQFLDDVFEGIKTHYHNRFPNFLKQIQSGDGGIGFKTINQDEDI